MRWNRKLPRPQTAEQVEVLSHVVKRLTELHEADVGAYVEASKAVGW
jgi:hypothetical protein